MLPPTTLELDPGMVRMRPCSFAATLLHDIGFSRPVKRRAIRFASKIDRSRSLPLNFLTAQGSLDAAPGSTKVVGRPIAGAYPHPGIPERRGPADLS